MMSADCLACIVRSQIALIHNHPESERLKSEYMFEVLGILSEAKDSSPQRMGNVLAQLHQRYFGRTEDMTELKQRYNRHLLRLVPRLERIIASAPDPLMSAICHAQAGNYIDFAMGQVDDDELLRLLERAAQHTLPETVYDNLVNDLQSARTLIYLCDNAGEIVLDRLLIERLRRRFPDLRITAMVRGARVLNDATMEDAREVGLTDIVSVVDNGTPLAGTELAHMPEDRRNLVVGSDVIISKGQGNFETMQGCGLNVYYMLLCKCDWFVRRYGMPRHTPMFVNERDVLISPYVD